MDERRFSEMERDVGRLEEKAEQIPVMTEQIAGLRREFADFRQSVNRRLDKQDEDQAGLRRTIVTFAFTVAGSAIAVLLALTQVVH